MLDEVLSLRPPVFAQRPEAEELFPVRQFRATQTGHCPTSIFSNPKALRAFAGYSVTKSRIVVLAKRLNFPDYPMARRLLIRVGGRLKISILMSVRETESLYEILRYLKEHPDARDTVEGISWWLLEQRMNDCLSEVHCTLAKLLAHGLLLEIEAGDARLHYQLNKSRIDEINLMLQRHDA